MATPAATAEASFDLELSALRRMLLGFAQGLRAFAPVSDAAVRAATFGLSCRLAMPEEDIVKNFDRRGNIVLQCLHPASHCWDLAGRARSCD
jgi:hypothetical protein